MTKPTAEELESHIIPSSDWGTAPAACLAEARKSSDEGVPTAIAHHPEAGWFILECGQGPYIAWQENP